MVKNSIAIILLVLVAYSCGSDKSPGQQQTSFITDDNTGISQTYTYKYSESINGNSCTTGSQTFNSKTAYCNGLKNHPLNNNCAYNQRSNAYAYNQCYSYTGQF